MTQQVYAGPASRGKRFFMCKMAHVVGVKFFGVCRSSKLRYGAENCALLKVTASSSRPLTHGAVKKSNF